MHQFCTAPESILHQIEGCERTIETGSSAMDCKPTVLDWNLEFNAAENDENQATYDNDDDYTNADDQTDQSDYFYQNEYDSSVSIQFNKNRSSSQKKTKRSVKSKQSNPHAKCEFCGQSFSFKSNLRVHQRNVHGFKRPYNCIDCDKRFQFKRHLVLHRSKHLKKLNQLECWLCHQT